MKNPFSTIWTSNYMLFVNYAIIGSLTNLNHLERVKNAGRIKMCVSVGSVDGRPWAKSTKRHYTLYLFVNK